MYYNFAAIHRLDGEICTREHGGIHAGTAPLLCD
jgi:hypothetical protein